MDARHVILESLCTGRFKCVCHEHLYDSALKHTTFTACRPYGKPVPYKKYWRAYEDVMRSLEGRPHWAKVSKASGQPNPCLKMAHSSSTLTGAWADKVRP